MSHEWDRKNVKKNHRFLFNGVQNNLQVPTWAQTHKSNNNEKTQKEKTPH